MVSRYSKDFDYKYKDLINQQLYSIDLNNPESEESILDWIYGQFKEFTESSKWTNRVDEQTDNVAYYLGQAAVPRTSGGLVSTNFMTIPRDNKTYKPLKFNYLKDLIDNTASRFISRKPEYSVYPSDPKAPESKKKAKTAKKALATNAKMNRLDEKTHETIIDSYVQGECYWHIHWDPNMGPFKLNEKERQKAKKVYFMSSDDVGIPVTPALRIGEVRTDKLDPRRVIVQENKDFDSAEWVIIIDYIPLESMRLAYPKYAKDLKLTPGVQYFDPNEYVYTQAENITVRFTLYHRSTPELPNGRQIICTPEVILFNDDLPYKEFIEKQKLPVIQLIDCAVPGSARGYAGTIMATGKKLQLMINNLWNIIFKNIATFTPLRMWPKRGGTNREELRSGTPMDVTYDEQYGAPKMISIDPVAQSVVQLIPMLEEKLMRLSNVMPPSRGVTIPNTESRLMLDFFKDQETAQSMPFDLKLRNFLVSWAESYLAIASEMYEDGDNRQIKYFGKRNAYTQETLSVKDLQIPVDVYVEQGGPFANTFEGKVSQIKDMLQIAPNALTPAEIVDILEVGSAEKMSDDITATINLAEDEIGAIMDGKKDVKSPERYLDLLPYYATYLRAVRKSEVRKILPDIYDPSGQDPGNRILTQIATIESLINDIITEENAPGSTGGPPFAQMVMQSGQPSFEMQVRTQFPSYPMVFRLDKPDPIDPFKIQQQALSPQPPAGQSIQMPGAIPGSPLVGNSGGGNSPPQQSPIKPKMGGNPSPKPPIFQQNGQK